MRLTLKIADPADLRGTTPSKSIERGQLTIGRAEAADWVLSDAERLLSKLHCRIEVRNDRFVLIDTSTNGVFVNESSSPLGNGGEKTLEDGDRLQLGRYTLLVSVETRREEPLSALMESLPPLPPQGAPATMPDEDFPDAGWTDAGFGAALPAHQEFFRPPSITPQGIPENWLEPRDAELSDPFEAPPPPPPAAAEPFAAIDLPTLPSASGALAELDAHLHALNDAVQAVIDSLTPDQATAAADLLARTYQAKMARYRGIS
jgi:type VI secretion system FHA domain protein